MGVSAIDHILLLSDDIDATADFYCRALGLRVGERPAFDYPGYWLYAEGGACVHVADRDAYYARGGRLGLRPPDGDLAGSIDHVAFAASDHGAALERLERNGIEAVRNVVPGGSLTQLFFVDPAGLRVEVNFVEAAGA